MCECFELGSAKSGIALMQSTITHKIFETNSSFHMK